MTHRISSKPLRALAAVAALAVSASALVAQDSATAPTNSAATNIAAAVNSAPSDSAATDPAATNSANTDSAPSIPSAAAPTTTSPTDVQLSFGVPDVLKLSQANVGEETILAYIQSPGRSFSGLSAAEIIYLHEQGVSDGIVNAMLNQRKQLTTAAAPTTPAPAPVDQPTPVAPAAPEVNAAASAPQYLQASAPPAGTYDQPATASTVVIFPNSATVVDSGYDPNYGYSGYYYPPVAFSFGFGGGYYHGWHHHGGHYHGGGGPHH